MNEVIEFLMLYEGDSYQTAKLKYDAFVCMRADDDFPAKKTSPVLSLVEDK